MKLTAHSVVVSNIKELNDIIEQYSKTKKDTYGVLTCEIVNPHGDGMITLEIDTRDIADIGAI